MFKTIKISTEAFDGNKYYRYFPMYIAGDYILLRKHVFNSESKKSYLIPLRLDMKNQSYEVLSSKDEEFVEMIPIHHSNKVLYITAADMESSCIYRIYILDIFSRIKEFVTEIIQDKVWKNPIYYETSSNIFGSRLKVFPISESYFLYLVDAIGQSGYMYDSANGFNKYNLFLYDIENGESYRVNDRSIYKGGIKSVEIVQKEDKKYIVIWSSLVSRREKESIYNSTICKPFVKELKEKILLLEVENFIDEVRKNSNVTQKVIETKGVFGALDLLSIYKATIYYCIYDFKEKSVIITKYDILHDSYERRILNYKFNYILYSNSNVFTVIDNKKNEQFVLQSVFSEFCYRYDKKIGRQAIIFDKERKIVTTGEVFDNQNSKYFSNVIDVSVSKINELKGALLRYFEEEEIAVLF